MRPATIAKAGRTAARMRLSPAMGRRRVRWRNVGRVACLAGAAVLIATHGSERRTPAPQPPTAAPGPRPTIPGQRRVQRLARLRDIPRLVLPPARGRRAVRPGERDGKGRRERRALKGDASDRREGVRQSDPAMRDQVAEPPASSRPTPPSPQPDPLSQPQTSERSATTPEPAPPPPPASGEFTPDRGP
jgi:hypothetical protein